MSEIEVDLYADLQKLRDSFDWKNMTKEEKRKALKECNKKEGEAAMAAEMKFQRKLKEKRRAQ